MGIKWPIRVIHSADSIQYWLNALALESGSVGSTPDSDAYELRLKIMPSQPWPGAHLVRVLSQYIKVAGSTLDQGTIRINQ